MAGKTENIVFNYTMGAEKSLSLTYMQGILPYLTLGGSLGYSLDKKLVQTSYAGIFDDGENIVSALWDTKVISISIFYLDFHAYGISLLY